MGSISLRGPRPCSLSRSQGSLPGLSQDRWMRFGRRRSRVRSLVLCRGSTVVRAPSSRRRCALDRCYRRGVGCWPRSGVRDLRLRRHGGRHVDRRSSERTGDRLGPVVAAPSRCGRPGLAMDSRDCSRLGARVDRDHCDRGRSRRPLGESRPVRCRDDHASLRSASMVPHALRDERAPRLRERQGRGGTSLGREVSPEFALPTRRIESE